MKRMVRWGILFILIACFIMIGRYLYLNPHVSLQAAREQSAALRLLLAERYVLAVVIFMLLGTIVAMTLLPIISLVALTAGFLFGSLEGGLYALCALTLGTFLTFLSFKYFFSSYIRTKVQGRLETFVKQLEQHGATYLLVLYLSSVVPGFLMVPLAAVAKVPVKTFVWTTFLGNIPFILVYSFAGKELGTISSIKDIFSPELLLVFLLLALIALAPLLIKKFSAKLRNVMVI